MRLIAGAQYERAFLSHRLANWEIPDTGKMAKASLTNRFDTVQPRTGKTSFIAGDNGYLDPKHKKAGVQAFTTTAVAQRPIHAESKPRWPKVRLHFLLSASCPVRRLADCVRQAWRRCGAAAAAAVKTCACA